MFTTTRQILRSFPRIQSVRKTSQFVNVAVNNDGSSTITLRRKPVNALNHELITQLHAALDSVEKDGAHGIILTSNNPQIFSAGLDLRVMTSQNAQDIKQTYSSLKSLAKRLLKMEIPSVCLINGHAIAGGCLLAASCDYRVMIHGHSIGMPDVAIGINIPDWTVRIFCNITSKRNTEFLLTTGALFDDKEAFRMGLIDEIAIGQLGAFHRCKAFFSRINHSSLISSHQKRNRNRNIFKTMAEVDIDKFVQNVQSSNVQDILKEYAK